MAKIPNVRKDSQISSSTHEVQKNLELQNIPV